jgi:hypothetical protein
VGLADSPEREVILRSTEALDSFPSITKKVKRNPAIGITQRDGMVCWWRGGGVLESEEPRQES